MRTTRTGGCSGTYPPQVSHVLFGEMIQEHGQSSSPMYGQDSGKACRG